MSRCVVEGGVCICSVDHVLCTYTFTHTHTTMYPHHHVPTQLSAPASCTSGSSCQCGVKGATQIHGQYHMQTLVSSSTKTLQLRTQSSNNDTGVIYSTQYQRTGSVSTPNQRLPWLQASTPTSRAAPIIIKADHNNPVPGARLRVDASVVSNQGVLCTVPIFVEFVGTLPVLPANGQAKPVQLLKNP